MKPSALLLALPLAGLAQSCSKKAPDPIVQTVHDTVTTVTRVSWTDTFVGRYTTDNFVRIDSQVALLHYISADTILFETKVGTERLTINAKHVAPGIQSFSYTAPDKIYARSLVGSGMNQAYYEYEGTKK